MMGQSNIHLDLSASETVGLVGEACLTGDLAGDTDFFAGEASRLDLCADEDLWVGVYWAL